MPEIKTCAALGCSKIRLARGLCQMHYYRGYRDGSLKTQKISRGVERCTHAGCTEPYHAGGYCQLHYTRASRGYPLDAKRRRAKGDGFYIADGYRAHTINGKRILDHRAMMEKKIGRSLYSHETVHHKNGVRSDNRNDNLELWSSSHPAGQRVKDKIAWAKKFLRQYGEWRL